MLRPRLPCPLSRLALPAALLLLFLVEPATAHNGAVAIAVPVEGVTVYGHLSDWPEGTAQYPIEMTAFGTPIREPGDLAATFQVGRDTRTGHLHVGVIAIDQSLVVDVTRPGRRWTQDGCEIHLARSHSDRPEAKAFVGDAPQSDDMTCAVIKVEG